MFNLQKIVAYAVKHGASDVHFTVGSPPAMRIDGKIHFVGEEVLGQKDTERFLDELMTERQRKRFDETGDYDLAYSIAGLGRFRVNVLRQRGSVGIVMRYVKAKIPSFDELNLPVRAMEKIATMPRGLVLITGTTGSGKSTTLAALVDKINEDNRCHIVTLEDPIEYLHTNKKSIITQREVSIDTQSFITALRAVMREDPDVILVGEMRDAETFQAAISAAETGHLVFSTLHTTNAMLTIDRIMDLFPANQQDQVRSQLALQLKGCVAQRLIPTMDGEGRVPAAEVMFTTPGIANLIRENNIKQIITAIAGGQEEGMQTFNQSLVNLVKARLISQSEAEWWSDNPDELKMNLQGIFLSSTSRGGILKK